jgi:hypothetical protein
MVLPVGEGAVVLVVAAVSEEAVTIVAQAERIGTKAMMVAREEMRPRVVLGKLFVLEGSPARVEGQGSSHQNRSQKRKQ